jgi:hypothetical protein
MMHGSEHPAFKTFSGTLEAPGREVCLRFRARVVERGEVEFDFDPILDPDVEWAFPQIYQKEGACRLVGTAEDGTSIDAPNFYINSLEIGTCIRLTGTSSLTILRYKLKVQAKKPLMRLHVKALRHYPSSRESCRLGTIRIHGKPSRSDSDIISGVIELQPNDAFTDPRWKADAEELLEHVRMMMSFARGEVLRAPITEFFEGHELEQIVRSQARQSSSPIPSFNYLTQQKLMFKTAVKSFCDPPIAAKNLLLAIEWFVLDSTYNEVRLMSAMTALENLLASNLTDTDAFIQPVDETKGESPEQKFRSETKDSIKRKIKSAISTWPPEARGQLYRKLDELNRRPFLDKLKILAERWEVPLTGLEEKLEAAKKARDHIVHRGEFAEQDFDKSWEHVTVVRELVVRFVLTAVGYRGPYISHLNGLHEAEFPPEAPDDR